MGKSFGCVYIGSDCKNISVFADIEGLGGGD